MNRKYPEVKGWWVYIIQVPSVGKFYIGVSGAKECSKRWFKKGYKSGSLAPYLEEWEDMNKNVIQDGLSKEEAYQLEDALIQCLSRYNLCINEQRSGLIRASDVNAYNREYKKQYYKNNTEYSERAKQRTKQWYENNKEKAKKYGKQYRENNKENHNEYQKQYYKNNPEYREHKKQYLRQWRLKKKLEQQQNQMNLF